MKPTLSAHRAEPPLGPPLPSVGSLSLIELSLGRGSRAFILRCRVLCVPGIGFATITSRNGLRLCVGDGTPCAEFDHVNRAFATRDQMTTG